MIQESVSLECEPASEPLHISREGGDLGARGELGEGADLRLHIQHVRVCHLLSGHSLTLTLTLSHPHTLTPSHYLTLSLSPSLTPTRPGLRLHIQHVRVCHLRGCEGVRV